MISRQNARHRQLETFSRIDTTTVMADIAADTAVNTSTVGAYTPLDATRIFLLLIILSALVFYFRMRK